LLKLESNNVLCLGMSIVTIIDANPTIEVPKKSQIH